MSCEGFLLSTYANTYGYTGLDMGFCGPRIYLIKLIMGKTSLSLERGEGGVPKQGSISKLAVISMEKCEGKKRPFSPYHHMGRNKGTTMHFDEEYIFH